MLQNPAVHQGYGSQGKFLRVILFILFALCNCIPFCYKTLSYNEEGLIYSKLGNTNGLIAYHNIIRSSYRVLCALYGIGSNPEFDIRDEYLLYELGYAYS